MGDESGLELSLGLSCGRSSGKAMGNKTNNAGSSSENHRAEGGDRSTKVLDDFKNFLQPTSQRSAEPSSGSQTACSVLKESWIKAADELGSRCTEVTEKKTVLGSLKHAYKILSNDRSSGDSGMVIVTGSLHVVSSVLASLQH